MSGETWQGPLHELSPDGTRGGLIAGSSAVIRRTSDAMEFEVLTSGLTVGNSYTVWVMAFNNPSRCQGTDAPPGFRCGMSDMANPETVFGLMFGAGAFAESETLELRGRRQVGDSSGVELDTAGLSDLSGAEIHLRVRDHGPVQPGLEEAQVGTIMGGCTDDSAPGGSGKRGDYPCRDVQATGF